MPKVKVSVDQWSQNIYIGNVKHMPTCQPAVYPQHKLKGITI
jgi:hypothetical protein